MFDIDIFEALGLLAILLCWASAAVLFRVGAPGSVARQLALLLLVEGITLDTSDINFMFLSPELFNQLMIRIEAGEGWPALWWRIEGIIHTLGDCAMLALYPAFLAMALQTKLTRPFGTPRMRIAVGFLAVMMFLAIQFTSEVAGTILLFAILTLLFGFALVASIHAWRVSPEGVARTRAGIFAAAFGFRDLCWGFVYFDGIFRILSGVYATAEDPIYIGHIYRLSTLVYVPIIAYGILRTQLFDIDLRIRWAVKQSTFAAVVLIIVFVLSEGAEWLVSAELGDAWGLVAAVVALLFMKPLQAFAERVVSVLMPTVKNTAEYKDSRKLEVYEAAVAETLHDEGISDRERTLLVHLRDSLGISASEADAIERKLRLRIAAPAAL